MTTLETKKLSNGAHGPDDAVAVSFQQDGVTIWLSANVMDTDDVDYDDDD